MEVSTISVSCLKVEWESEPDRDYTVTCEAVSPDYAQETEELDKSQIASLADKFNATVEEQLEDDYNMIDGIINNGSRKGLEKTRADLTESIEAAQTIADNHHIRQEMREMANEDIARLQGELAVVEKALSSLDTVNEERT